VQQSVQCLSAAVRGVGLGQGAGVCGQQVVLPVAAKGVLHQLGVESFA
jgi:hypothetical protein